MVRGCLLRPSRALDRVSSWPAARIRRPVLAPVFLAVALSLPAGSRPAPHAAANAPSQGASAPTLGGCQVFPADNIWNAPVDALPVDANSQAYVNTIGAGAALKADFGAGLWNGGPIGIPYVVVPSTQAKSPVSFRWPDESDAGPYPIPANPPIEGGNASTGDRHILMVDKDSCTLYELYHVFPQNGGGWKADSGAIFDLRSNTLRPDTWTSADAAGLAILPGLARYDEVAAGEIRHALRFTVPETRRAYVWPGRHYASSNVENRFPPMGQRFRLKAGVNIAGYPADVQVILRALKTYGMMLSDNGSAWFISGVPDERWNNDNLSQMRKLKGSDFEAVNVSSLMVNKDSGQVKGGPTPSTPVTPTRTPEPELTPTPEASATSDLPIASATPLSTPIPTRVTPTADGGPSATPSPRPSAIPTDSSGVEFRRLFVPYVARNGGL